ncbi:MAG: DUF4832 domain-containing protein [Bacteroidota bacterium]
MRPYFILLLYCYGPVLSFAQSASCGGAESFSVLHFTKTNGFDHNTRNQSFQMFSDIGLNENFTVVTTQDAAVFEDLASLQSFEVIIFSNTSGNNLLNAEQRSNMEAYIAGGGAFLGIHAATDTYRNGSWPFYNSLVGAIVQSGPNHTSSNHVNDMDHIEVGHPILNGIPDPWNKREEYYYWELNGGQIDANISELLRVRQTGNNSYDAARPISWYKELDNGARSFYTALGHHRSDYTGSSADAEFQLLLRNALCWCVEAEAETTINYQSSEVDFVNPERGFYRYTETRSTNYNNLSANDLMDFRNPYTPFGASYSVVSSLAFRYFFLEDFTAGPIDQSYLDQVAADFAAARTAGVKIIPRFAYTDNVDGSGCPSFICPPYGDAPKNIVLGHIDQLAPILAANKDVIAAVQMGFIGVWGENYYTDYFGDASPEGNGQLYDSNWVDRNEVLAAMLTAVPAERMVQVRYPQAKQRLVYGLNALTTVAPLDSSLAYGDSSIARIGFHNDCLLAGPDDFGTYADYGNNASGANSDTTHLKPYFAADSRFVVVGGETCSDGYNPQNDCSGSDPLAFGELELRRMHYSYLNADYNQEVNNDWVLGGCMEDIKRQLGYRIELRSAQLPTTGNAGDSIPIQIELENVGYAAPYNPRLVELLLRETTSGEIWRAALDDDPRYWLPEEGTHTISATPCLPDGMPSGTYEYLLHLPDPEIDLYGRPDYSIRLASLLMDDTDVWEANSGFNRLGDSIQVSAGVNSCSNTLVFEPDNPALPVELLSLTASAEEQQIRINWETAAEEALAGFSLERSTDARTFQSIAWLPAQMRPTGRGTYQYLDTEVVQGIDYFYRLRSEDIDGSFEYSFLVRAKLGTPTPLLTIWPNPANDRLQLRWQGEQQPDGQIQLIDALGRAVLQQAFRSEISLAGLPVGTYTLILRTDQHTIVQRLIIE